MGLIFNISSEYIKDGTSNQHHSLPSKCLRKKVISSLTQANILYLKSLGYDVRTTTVIPGTKV